MKKVFCKNCKYFKTYHHSDFGGPPSRLCEALTGKTLFCKIEGEYPEKLRLFPHEKNYPNNNFNCKYYLPTWLAKKGWL